MAQNLIPSFESLGLTPRVLDATELEEVYHFEKSRLQPEDEIASWSAPWREESLRHYLPLGWCFALRDSKNLLRAYFLAQPLLFFGGHTQTLWVEYISAANIETQLALIDLARRYSRDKHLQKVIINAPGSMDLTQYGAVKVTGNTFEFPTTKMASI